MSRIKEVFEVDNSGWVTIEVIDLAGNSHIMDVKSIDLDAFEDGELIQSAFPYLTNEQRELILTGLTNEMWDEVNSGYEEMLGDGM